MTAMLTFKVQFSHVIQYQKRVTGHFETIALMILKIAFNTTKSKVAPPWSAITPQSMPKFHSVLFSSQPFQVTDDFEPSSPNDPKMTLNTKR